MSGRDKAWEKRERRKGGRGKGGGQKERGLERKEKGEGRDKEKGTIGEHPRKRRKETSFQELEKLRARRKAPSTAC